MDVAAAAMAGGGIIVVAGSWEHRIPQRLSGRMRVLALQRLGHRGVTGAVLEVLQLLRLDQA
jgi:hypothetical protein